MSVVTKIEMHSKMKDNFDGYASPINFGRAIPDVRDGLKAGARATLEAGFNAGMYGKDKPSVSAELVGATMAKYYPHGDSGIYDGIVTMTHSPTWGKPFRNHLFYIHGSGNWGSLDENAAAYRYTKCQISEHGLAMMGKIPEITGATEAEIKQNGVVMMPNYTGDRKQAHDVLPAILPGFLVNAVTNGIGVGKSTRTAPHNLNEVLDAAYYMVKHPNLSIEKLRSFIPAPDVPADCDIYDSSTYSDINSYYETGSGSFVMRGRYEIEPYEVQVSSGRKPKYETYHRIIVTGLPFQVSASSFIESMQEAIEDDKLQDGISVRNRSGADNIRVEIDCFSIDVNDVLNRLLAFTNIQETYSVYAEAIIDGYIRRVGVKEAINQWLDHRRSVIKRRSIFRKERYLKRLEIVDGYLIAIPNSSEVVEMIRSSESRQEAIDNLIAHPKWGFTENQATAIMELTMSQITKMGRGRYEEEQKSLSELIQECDDILNDIDERLRKEIKLTKKHFGIERRSRFIDGEFADVIKPTASANPIPEVEGIIVKTNKDWVRWVKRANVKNFVSDGNYITSRYNVTDAQTIEAVSEYGWLYREWCGSVPDKMTNSSLFFNGLDGGEQLIMVEPNVPSIIDDRGVDLILISSIDGSDPGIRRIAYDVWTKQNNVLVRL